MKTIHSISGYGMQGIIIILDKEVTLGEMYRILCNYRYGYAGTLPFAKSLLKEKYSGKVLAATKVPVQEFTKHSQLKLRRRGQGTRGLY